MYILRIQTALGTVIQHTDHCPVYLEKLAAEYSGCRRWALMRGASLVKKYVNDSHLPASLRVQAE
jgi:hypothetical protein